MDQFKLYKATVHLRRGDGWDVRPECEQTDGVEAIFRPGWLMTKEDTSIYVGEWAMIPRVEDWPVDSSGWVASGDLQDIEIHEINKGVVKKVTD